MNLTVSSKLVVWVQCFFAIKTVILNILIKAASVFSVSHNFHSFNCSSTLSTVHCDLKPETIKIFSVTMFSSLTKKELLREISELFSRDYQSIHNKRWKTKQKTKTKKTKLIQKNLSNLLKLTLRSRDWQGFTHLVSLKLLYASYTLSSKVEITKKYNKMAIF